MLTLIRTIALKAMFVVCHDVRDGLERMYNQPGDVREQLIGNIFSSSGLQIQPQVCETHLASVNTVVVLPVLLYRHVCQVDVHVVQLSDVSVVLDRAESTRWR